jgi:hypothetical protein
MGDEDDLTSELPAEPTQPSEESTVDAADPKQYRRRVRDSELRDKERDAFWRLVLNDPVGRRELWAFFENHHAFDDPFAVGPSGMPHDAATYYKQGQKRACTDLINCLARVDRAAFFLMLDENDFRFQTIKPKASR